MSVDIRLDSRKIILLYSILTHYNVIIDFTGMFEKEKEKDYLCYGAFIHYIVSGTVDCRSLFFLIRQFRVI